MSRMYKLTIPITITVTRKINLIIKVRVTLFSLYLFKNVFFFFRKALKEFTPLKTDATESEQFNSILNEIEVLKKLSSKTEYVIKYLDSFSTDVLSRFKVYNIVTNLYEVNYSIFIA